MWTTVPVLGGTSAVWPFPDTLKLKTPAAVLLTMRLRTFAEEEVHLKPPLTRRHRTGDAGRSKTSFDGVVPPIETSSMAPLAIGSPVIVVGLADSFAKIWKDRLPGSLARGLRTW